MSSSVFTDNSLLSRIEQKFYRIESAFNLIAGLVLFMLVFLAVVHVVSRKLLNAPVPGFVDWVEQSMAVFAFLGIAYCQRLGGHIRMDIVVSKFKGRVLWFSEFVSVSLMLIITCILVYGSWFHFVRSFDFAAPLFSRDSSIDIALPLWPAKFLVPLALSVLAVRLFLQAWGYWRAFYENAERPIAVPMIEDAAMQAANEAETVSGAGQ